MIKKRRKKTEYLDKVTTICVYCQELHSPVEKSAQADPKISLPYFIAFKNKYLTEQPRSVFLETLPFLILNFSSYYNVFATPEQNSFYENHNGPHENSTA